MPNKQWDFICWCAAIKNFWELNFEKLHSFEIKQKFLLINGYDIVSNNLYSYLSTFFQDSSQVTYFGYSESPCVKAFELLSLWNKCIQFAIFNKTQLKILLS